MIRVVNLYKSFGGQQVLKGINLEVETGKITTIIGGSGSGKTVLLKHLNALLLPDRGSVLVDETDITKLGENALNKIRKKFGVLFQNAALLDSMTIYDNVAFPLRETTKLSESDIQKRAEERLAQVGLARMGYKYPAELSGGMKKSTGITRAQKFLWVFSCWWELLASVISPSSSESSKFWPAAAILCMLIFHPWPGLRSATPWKLPGSRSGESRLCGWPMTAPALSLGCRTESSFKRTPSLRSGRVD